jgi:hypothetical protein
VNRATVDGRILKREILASWRRNNGPGLLDRLAQVDYRAYLKMVVTLVPRHDEPEPVEPESTGLTAVDVVRIVSEHRGQAVPSTAAHEAEIM